MTVDPLNNVRKIDLNGEEITLDPKLLVFNDATLAAFKENLSVWYDYYSSKSAKAEELLANAEIEAETEYDKKFLEAKTEGGMSDKSAEAFARSQHVVKELHKQEAAYKSSVKQMKEYLKSLDKAHSLAISRGFQINKELDKLPSSKQIDVSDIIGKSSHE